MLIFLKKQAENVNDNLFLEHFMANHGLFEALIQVWCFNEIILSLNYQSCLKVLSNTESRSLFGKDVLLLLTILLQYRKYDSENPFIIKLSILDNEMALTGIAMIMSGVLAEFNRYYFFLKKLKIISIFLAEIMLKVKKNKKVNRHGGIMLGI